MLEINQEIISLHRRSSDDLYKISCDLVDATKAIPVENRFREGLLPDIGHLRVGSVDYVRAHMYPSIDSAGAINRWTGVVIEHDTKTRLPKVIGSLCVRPNIVQPFRKPEFDTMGNKFAIIDAWNSAINHDEVLDEQLKIGLEVAKKLFPSNIAIIIESDLKKSRREEAVRSPMDSLIRKRFPIELTSGTIHRYDPARTLIRDGVQKGQGVVRSSRNLN